MAASEASFGKRARSDDRRRWLAYALIGCAIGAFEFAVAPGVEREVAAAVAQSAGNWALAEMQSPDAHARIPAKEPGRLRLLYVSNSHAATGGHVARHLQSLLDAVAPSRIEVVDVSAPGIFAPDILQRVLRSLAYEPDLVVLAPAYISFSDRMKLPLQARSARSFFKDRVASGLSAGFWLRNYDLGVYGEALFGRLLRTYAYRDRIRDAWEKPAIAALQGGLSDRRPVRFLDVDENQGWRFPDGYDSNLFQWNLYAAGRRNHLADLAEAIAALRGAGVPCLGANLPIDFGKSTSPHSPSDYAEFRASLRALFAGAVEYVDYQEFFPVEFSTYDALHPNWHGARLHALDLAARIAHRGLLGLEWNPQRLLDQFGRLDRQTTDRFRGLADAPGRPDGALRRFDISEPQNARNLLALVGATTVSTPYERHLVLGLALRIRYWSESRFAVPEAPPEPLGAAWQAAVADEIAAARERAGVFRAELARLQTRRLRAIDLPLAGAHTVATATLHIDGQEVGEERLALPDDSVVLRYTSAGRPFALRVFDARRNLEYQRVDVLGDGSFVFVADDEGQLVFPPWMQHETPFRGWGV